MTTTGSPEFRIKGWHVLAGVVGFFAAVIAIDGYFVALAYRSYPGEVSATPYQDGVRYNRKLAQFAAQERLGWRVAASVTPVGAVLVQVRDRAGAPVSGLAADARLERPATQAGRIRLVFTEQAPGDYLARPGRLSGAWDLSVALRGSPGRFEAERRLSWR